ncbi:MAG: hypothetical protein ACREM2_05810, partial [Vulcanimicrobiaceae bacterium]
MTKLIDAALDLSVQVRPHDHEAVRLDGATCGKSECWYVLEAAAGSALWLGWQRPTSRGFLSAELALCGPARVSPYGFNGAADFCPRICLRWAPAAAGGQLQWGRGFLSAEFRRHGGA